jgi:hypothetical protein
MWTKYSKTPQNELREKSVNDLQYIIFVEVIGKRLQMFIAKIPKTDLSKEVFLTT